MWKTLAVVSILVCISLLVWNVRLRDQLATEQEFVAALTEEKAHADAEMKSELGRYNLLQSSCRSLTGNVPAVGVCATVVPTSSQADANFRFQRTPSIPTMLVLEGMRWNLLSSLVLSDEERIAMSRILSAEQKKLRAAMEASPTNSLDMSVARAVRVETDRQIYALLGEDRFLEFADYREFPQGQSRVGELNRRLMESGKPALSAQARSALLLALKEEVRPELLPNSSGLQAVSADAYEIWRKGYEQRVRGRATAFLTEEQLRLFDRQRSLDSMR